MIDKLKHIISSVPGISLQELGAVDFDSRIDTKFVFHKDKLPEFLSRIKNDLQVLDVNGDRLFQYENLYCDSNDFEFFKRHHSGFGNRSKVRVRKYSDKGPFFFEVKKKTNKGKTVKHRIPIESFNKFENPDTENSLVDNTGFSFETLSKRTGIDYKRMTFSNLAFSEKLTVDFDLVAKNKTDKFKFENLVIVEVKQIKYSSRSPFIAQLKKLKIYKTSFSKYCASVAVLNSDLKQNRFLPIIKNINKIARA
ncbi:MAG: polyphosphate polymerase domain-containing protein [Salibacteraceae bacterium]